MKYAIYCVLDQTIGYLCNKRDGAATIHHPSAVLFDTEIEATQALVKFEYEGVEEVPDENEFRNREDTW